MAINDNYKEIIINGHIWKDVTNETYAGIAYPLKDVIVNGGMVPTWDSSNK